MNRLSLLILLAFSGMCLEAQTSSTITISTSSPGPHFLVDGTLHTTTATLNWPAGSVHTVVFLTDPTLPGQVAGSPVQTSGDGGTKWLFTSWVDNLGLIQPMADPIQVITANPNITTLTAQVTVSYRVNLNYFSSGIPNDNVPSTCGAPGAIPPGVFRPGVVYINSQCFWTSTVVFLPANTSLSLNAYPYPGFVFTGWSINGASPSSFLTQVTLNEQMNITPYFEPGKLVSFLTSPIGMDLFVDHTQVHTRTLNDIPGCPNNETQPVVTGTGFPPVCFGDFYFAPGSSHFLSGVSPQRDNTGKWWVFSGWSNGNAPNSLYQVDNNTSAVIMTGNYVPGAQVAFLTTPGGLQLNVDGRTWPSYAFIWGMGTTHQVSAAATQTGADGRKYTFKSWSNGGNATQTYTVDQTAVTSGYRMTAVYSALSRLVVQSSPPGLNVQVDGASCATPCNIDRETGSTVHVTAPTQLPMGTGSRLDFASWSDGGASDHTVTISQDFATVTASYNTSYQLSASSNPGNGSAFKISPSSSDMFYPQGTQVSVTAMPNTGFKFGHWTGALSGSFPSGTITLLGPQSVVAQMITVPYIAPAGILNGAGQTPSSAVAPGSIVSIFGQNLASTVQVGPVNPLSQTIAGVTVTVNDLILPLMFVSPQQINAELPSSLAPGNYTLQIQNAGQPNITGTFTVARNAPGLFYQTTDSVNYAMALHADGSMVTTDSPAAAGETISLLGTGFGPYQQTVLDGFFPPNPPPAVADSVLLSVGGVNPSATTTAAPGFTAVDLTQFQVPSGLGSATSVPVLVTINGVDSNTVMLPLQ